MGPVSFEDDLSNKNPGQTDRQTDRQTDGQTDRRTDGNGDLLLLTLGVSLRSGLKKTQRGFSNRQCL